MIIDIVACQRKMSYIKKKKKCFISVSCHIYYCEQATVMAIRTKAWVLHCTSLGLTSMHFVIIHVLVCQSIIGKGKKEIAF